MSLICPPGCSPRGLWGSIGLTATASLPRESQLSDADPTFAGRQFRPKLLRHILDKSPGCRRHPTSAREYDMDDAVRRAPSRQDVHQAPSGKSFVSIDLRKQRNPYSIQGRLQKNL